MDDETQLEDAENILAKKKELLKKYPDKFSLRLSVREWSHTVDLLKKKSVESRSVST